MKNRIFLVEDDVNFGLILKSYLEMNGFKVTHIADGQEAMNTFQSDTYDLCVLDVMLPNVDGFTIGKKIRDLDQGMPLIFLTAKSLKDDIMKGFEIGADDYVTKPFDSDVLLYKIKAILKRSDQVEDRLMDEVVSIGNFSFNTQMRTLSIDSDSQKLSPREGDLLKLLYSHKNKVLDRNYALKNIWGDDNYFNARSMDVYITKLRKYLKKDDRIQINNVHSSGFILVTPE